MVPNEPLFKWQTYSKMYTDDKGKLLRLTLAADERYRLWISLDQIPKELIQASILYEDRYFYDHPGVNLPALWKAFVSTYFTGSRRVGASTISMQVARIAFGLESRKITGKLQQIFYALWLEQHYSKQEILEFYFNVVSFGGNIEGIEAASQIYFHKTAMQLSLPEMLALAVIPQNPHKRNPVTSKGYTRMSDGRKILYEKYKKRYLTLKQSKNQDLWMDLKLNIFSSTQLPFYAPHFTRYLSKLSPFDSGEIKTTLNFKMQQQVKKKIQLWVNHNRRYGINNASALLLNHKTMEIKAWVGSKDFFDRDILGQVDAVTAKRSPGSTLKPFVYALALDQGLIHPKTLLKDAPYRFGAYTPENFDKSFLGPISATKALISSRNVPAVKLSANLEDPSLYEFLQKAQVSQMKEAKHYGMAIALGGLETSMFEMARLYAILANDGLLKEIKVKAKEKDTESTQLLSPESAWLILDMLKQNPRPKRTNFLGKGNDSVKYAWKTGTSYAFRDAWSVGVSDEYVLVVWVGNFDGRSNNSFIGREAAAPLFFNILDALGSKSALASKADPVTQFLNLSKINICKITGTLPNKLCPELVKSWFIPGVSPISSSNIFRQVPINIKSGLRGCYHKKGITKLKTFEFWPSDLKQIFHQAGIKKPEPPKYEKACANLNVSSYNEAPEIHSPAQGIIYTIQQKNLKSMKIPFTAVLDADSHKAFWFIDKEYLGSVNGSETLFWKAKLGKFMVRVVDEKGLSSSRKIEVQIAH